MKRLVLWIMIINCISQSMRAGDDFSIARMAQRGSLAGSIVSLVYWGGKLPELSTQNFCEYASRVLLDSLTAVTMHDKLSSGSQSRGVFLLNSLGSLGSGMAWTLAGQYYIKTYGWKNFFTKTTIPYRILLDALIFTTSVGGVVSPRS